MIIRPKHGCRGLSSWRRGLHKVGRIREACRAVAQRQLGPQRLRVAPVERADAREVQDVSGALQGELRAGETGVQEVT